MLQLGGRLPAAGVAGDYAGDAQQMGHIAVMLLVVSSSHFYHCPTDGDLSTQ